ncbi:MAG: hypothetical protein ACM3X2_00535 [Pseudomonadota bacterium]|jgi:hypothetical protein
MWTANAESRAAAAMNKAAHAATNSEKLREIVETMEALPAFATMRSGQPII